MSRAIRAMLFLLFYPSRFVPMAVEHDIALEFETNKQLLQAYPNRKLPTERRREFEDKARDRTRKIRRSFGYAFVIVPVALACGWLSGIVARQVLGSPSSSIVAAFQMFAAVILLAATLSVLGWEIQSYNGRTLPEKVNRWLYRILYVIGTYILVFSLSWSS